MFKRELGEATTNARQTRKEEHPTVEKTSVKDHTHITKTSILTLCFLHLFFPLFNEGYPVKYPSALSGYNQVTVTGTNLHFPKECNSKDMHICSLKDILALACNFITHL